MILSTRDIPSVSIYFIEGDLSCEIQIDSIYHRLNIM
jgi:hypothetical protein